MEHSFPLPKVSTQGEARHIAFLHHAKTAKELANLALTEIEEAIVENQINMAGCEVVASLEGKEWVVGL